MRKLYTLGHSQCRLQSRAQVGASSPFASCTRFVFVLLLLLGGVMQGVVGQAYNSGYPKVDNITSTTVDVVTNLNFAPARTYFVIVPSDWNSEISLEDIKFESYYIGPGDEDYESYPFVGNISVTAASTRPPKPTDVNVSKSLNVVGLTPNTDYKLFLVTVKSLDINSTDYLETVPTVIPFTTPAAPTLVAENPLSPANFAAGVLLGANLTATFDVPVQFNSGSEPKTISIKDMSTGRDFATFSVSGGQSSSSLLSISDKVLTIDPSSTLNFEYGTNYQVYIQSGALESEIGIPFGGIAAGNWSFTTENAPAPVGTMVTPTGTNISILTDVVITYPVAIRNLDDSAITDANVKDLIKIYRGSVALENLIPEAGYTATIAADKKSITIRLVPGGYYFPNAHVNVVINQVENNQDIQQNLAQTFTFETGQYNIWRGTTDSNWNNPANWQSSYVQGNSIIIESGSHGAELDVDLTAPNLIIGKGGKLTVNANKTLTVSNDFRMYSVNGTGASASLVVNGTLSTDATKTFVYQGITNSTFNYYVSSPVNVAVKSVVNPDGRMYAYNTATDVFDRLADDAVLTPLKGYGAMAPADSWLSFSGSLNGGDYSLPCTRTAKNYGWNLAGNPYPCAIDLQKTYGAGGFSNLRDHIYIRDNETFIQNVYNFSSEVGTLSGNAVVPAMHSFWVQVKPGFIEGTFSVKNTDRVHNSFNYHKSASATPVQKPTIKLFAQNGAVKDLSVITFIPGNDDAYDAYDSEKRLARNNLVTDLYTIKDGMRLVINSFGEYSGSKEVPIGVYARKAGTYTLGIASMAGFDQEVELKLVDYGTSPATTHDLSTGDYSFTVAADTYIDHRFVLQVSNKVATGVEQPEANREVTIYAFQSDVVIENKGDAVGQYTIYDLSGRAIISGELGAFSKVSAPMPVKGVVLGVVKTSKGMVNQKLLIQ